MRALESLAKESEYAWEGFNLSHEKYEASIENGKMLIACKGKEVLRLDKSKTKEFTDWIEREQKHSKSSKEEVFAKLMVVLAKFWLSAFEF